MATDSARTPISATTEDGVTLTLHRFPARGSRRAVCLCTHAMMANSRYFWAAGERSFIGHLNSRGVEVFALDWRGHGASPMPSGRTSWHFDDYVTHDAPTAVRAVCRHAGIERTQLAYLGHSLGGLVGLAALGSGALPPLGTLSLWATSVWLPGPRGPLIRRLTMRALALSSRLHGRAPVRRLRLGSDDEPASYVRQLAGWATTGAWRGRDGSDFLARLWQISMPAWAVVGAGDRLCRPADARVLLDRLPDAAPLRVVGPRAGDSISADHFTLFTDPTLTPLRDEFVQVITESRT